VAHHAAIAPNADLAPRPSPYFQRSIFGAIRRPKTARTAPARRRAPPASASATKRIFPEMQQTVPAAAAYFLWGLEHQAVPANSGHAVFGVASSK
jgi:hypothetical protein